MTQEEKQLLLKDLCARLPYGVKVNFRGNIEILREVHVYKSVQTIVGESGMLYDIDMPFVKPYLRPMSSMTEEEIDTMWNIIESDAAAEGSSKVTDLLNQWHLDHHHLIEKGLALEEKEGMYKEE